MVSRWLQQLHIPHFYTPCSEVGNGRWYQAEFFLTSKQTVFKNPTAEYLNSFLHNIGHHRAYKAFCRKARKCVSGYPGLCSERKTGKKDWGMTQSAYQKYLSQLISSCCSRVSNFTWVQNLYDFLMRAPDTDLQSWGKFFWFGLAKSLNLVPQCDRKLPGWTLTFQWCPRSLLLCKKPTPKCSGLKRIICYLSGTRSQLGSVGQLLLGVSWG